MFPTLLENGGLTKVKDIIHMIQASIPKSNPLLLPKLSQLLEQYTEYYKHIEPQTLEA